MPNKTKNDTYHFYYPIYNLRNPSDKVKLGYSTILTFDSLPKTIQESFLLFWKNYFTIYTEWAKTEQGYINRKKTSTFLHLNVKAKSNDEAIEKAFKLVKESVSILDFVYWAYFPLHHCFYVKKDFEISGGAGDYYYIPSLWICEYQSKYEEEMSKLTRILKNPKCEIDRKIRNTLIIFRLQTSVTNEQVRFVLLTTCLESLLVAKSDRDYLRWKLAEKTAFLGGKNQRLAYKWVKDAYDKRSTFIHGSSSEIINKDDVNTMQGTVISILRRLMSLRENGFKNMDDIRKFIEKMKFREN